METFKKYAGNPVLGSEERGVCFDVYVTREAGRYRMDFSWRTRKALAVTFSEDGIHWEEPQITLQNDLTTGWEDDVNRNCVLKIGNTWKMWYTGQARGHSFIGYAESGDGLHFRRVLSEPVMISEYPYEGFSVMNPCVLFEEGRYRMWYAAGETYEPNVLAYAESSDGIHWKKSKINPILVGDRHARWEQDRVGGCQVLKVDGEYYVFYIGYEDIDTARICLARSRDGVRMFERSLLNPLVEPTAGEWDADACYKPSALWEEETGKWRIWYNGRRGHAEYIGMAEKAGKELF